MYGWRAVFWVAFLGVSIVFIRPFMADKPDGRSQPRFMASAYNLGVVRAETPAVMRVTGEVKNTSKVPGDPICVLYYGTQIVLVREPYAVSLNPGETMWIAGDARFPLPLDDNESGGFECYRKIPHWMVLEMSRPSINLVTRSH